jgi:sulfide:quinone oxidoreductase
VRGSSSTKVLIAGGGVAALEAALALRSLEVEGLGVELIAPEPHFWYRPMSVAEPFRLGEVARFELAELAAAAGATVSPTRLVGVDAERRLAYTSSGTALPYDALLIASGALARPAIPGAVVFRGPADVERIRGVLGELAAGDVRRVAFAAPVGAAWALPLYELALLTAAHLDARDARGVELAVVTPEEEPLGLFGARATAAIRRLLEERGISVRCGAYAAEAREGELRLIPEGSVPADRVIALPRLQGAWLEGVPQTLDGFVPVDPHGRVHGLDDVYAAGDVTNFPVKRRERTSSRSRSGRCCAGSCSRAGGRATCAASWPAARATRRSSARSRCGGLRRRSSAATWPRSWPASRESRTCLRRLRGRECASSAPSTLVSSSGSRLSAGARPPRARARATDARSPSCSWSRSWSHPRTRSVRWRNG